MRIFIFGRSIYLYSSPTFEDSPLERHYHCIGFVGTRFYEEPFNYLFQRNRIDKDSRAHYQLSFEISISNSDGTEQNGIPNLYMSCTEFRGPVVEIDLRRKKFHFSPTNRLELELIQSLHLLASRQFVEMKMIGAFSCETDTTENGFQIELAREGKPMIVNAVEGFDPYALLLKLWELSEKNR